MSALVFEDRVSHWTWSLTFQQGWLMSKCRGFASLPCSYTNTIVTAHGIRLGFLTWVLGIRIQVLICAQQELYSLIHLSNSFILLYLMLVPIYFPTKKYPFFVHHHQCSLSFIFVIKAALTCMRWYLIALFVFFRDFVLNVWMFYLLYKSVCSTLGKQKRALNPMEVEL